MHAYAVSFIEIISLFVSPNIQEKERIEKIRKDTLAREWDLAVKRCNGGAIPRAGKLNGMKKK